MTSVASDIAGILWPPLCQSRQRPLQALLEQFDRIERAPLVEIVAGQERQLQALGTYLCQFSPLYRQRMIAAGLDPAKPLTLAALHCLPPMTRRQFQRAGEEPFCQQIPADHLPVGETRTSGSSGEPVVVRRTQVNQLFWLANTMREHRWWQRDLNASLAIVRANLPQPYIRQEGWGPPASLLGPSGPVHAFSMSLDTASLAQHLVEIQPQYLLIYPTVLDDLLRHFHERGGALSSLQQIRCIGETLRDELREATRKEWGVEIVDSYSSQEMGVIAIQCPDSGLYHLMADNLVVEVLDDQARACGVGEIGEVVITDLHNFATPLVRYAIGDHAEVGPPCGCGCNFPTLRRILGRSRNMLRYPDGCRRWPRVGFDRYRDVAPVQQYQLVQYAPEAIEVRLVVARTLANEEEAALGRIIREALGYPFELRFRYFNDNLPRGARGKFEEFICQCE